MSAFDVDLAGRSSHNLVEQPIEGVLPSFTSHKIFIDVVASYFRFWLLMYIATHYSFRIDVFGIFILDCLMLFSTRLYHGIGRIWLGALMASLLFGG